MVSGSNIHGLDITFFKKKLNGLIDDIDNSTPNEFARSCLRMSITADESVLLENEFNTTKECGWVSCAGGKTPTEDGNYWAHWDDGQVEISNFLGHPWGNCFQRKCGTNENHEGFSKNVGVVTHFKPLEIPSSPVIK